MQPESEIGSASGKRNPLRKDRGYLEVFSVSQVWSSSDVEQSFV